MAYTDYKWAAVNRDDDGYITWAKVRFYTGAYESREDPETKQQVQVYVRKTRIDPAAAAVKTLASDWAKDTDLAGNPVVHFTAKDFGKIKTDDELRKFCNAQIGKLKTLYTVIPEQVDKLEVER